MTDWPMCERCGKEVQTTIDIWVQGFSYHHAGSFDPITKKEDVDAKSFEVDGRDYIALCEDCWGFLQPLWEMFCRHTTTDHPLGFNGEEFKPKGLYTYEEADSEKVHDAFQKLVETTGSFMYDE